MKIHWLGSMLGLAGCVGIIGDGKGGSGDPTDPVNAVSSPLTRIARLTHHQYDNTIADLLKVTPATLPSSSFAPDASFAGYDNNADSLAVAGTLPVDYQRAAEALAADAVTKSFAALVPCTPTGDGSACATQFVTQFGRRAFRRPLAAEEITKYVGAFQNAKMAYVSTNTFANGVQMVIETMLQSPLFLYRAELSRTRDDIGQIPLSDFEIASRLSYMLWNTMPDDALSGAADKSEVHTNEQIRAQALRMLADPRAHATMQDFHSQWLQLSRYSTNFLMKDAAVYPNFAPTMAPTLAQEADRFIDDVAFTGSFQSLLTASHTFANADTAPLYGLQGSFGAGMQKVNLDPARRSGFLTQIGFLASHAYTTGDSPIHRGVFIQRQLLCNKLPDPPAGVDFQLPPPSAELKTTRDRVTAHTNHAPCTSCHTGIINPTGFAFEHYDGVGAWRDVENNAPVDSAASIILDGKDTAFKDAVELSKLIAASPQAQRCYVVNMMRYAYGKEEVAADDNAISTLATKVANPSYGVRELVVDLTQIRSFTHRPFDGSMQ